MASLVSLTFDDGLRCQFDDALSRLNRLRIPATFFLIANQQPTHEGRHNEWWKIEWSESDIMMLREAVQQGHEVGSHSVTHDFAKMPTQPEFEAVESKRLIENWMGTEISSFAYPYYRTYLTEAVQKAGYQGARAGAENTYHRLGSSLNFNLDCRQVSSEDNVRDWIRPDHWHILTFHGIGNQRSGWAPIPIDRFAAMLTELAELRSLNAVELVTFKDALEQFACRRPLQT
jgi:peptidoglycan/xylan/chitin deacetylase (PgdA/CDA1 family)